MLLATNDLSPDERKVVEYLISQGSTKRAGIETLLACKESKACAILNTLCDASIVVRKGKGKNTYYNLPHTVFSQMTSSNIEDDTKTSSDTLDQTSQSFYDMLKKGNVNAISLIVHLFNIVISDKEYCYPKGMIDAALAANVKIVFTDYPPDRNSKILMVKHPRIDNQNNQYFSSMISVSQFNKYIAAIQKGILPNRMFLTNRIPEPDC